ncbi:helix-turn-helix domain-containing protein [uncultured Bacteroides sp.]|uniref:GlxA family transcriptional regulator n=1 Tax=uncultured Bacteroides sp. TaxID=162156 RepID=UPI002AA6EB30|nr:helix-turn-helix domain-containing protein [uncultured Bacteroides sp.]
MQDEHEIRHIVILAPENSTLLNIAGPLEVFDKAIEKFEAIREKMDFEYVTHVVSTGNRKMIATSGGLSILSEGSYKAIDYSIDTLIISALPKLEDYEMNRELIGWLKKQSVSVRRICSICSAAFFLAEAGLLDGKEVTTHWAKSEDLARMYPRVKVEIARIFSKDGNVYTAGGISSGMDLALALVEEDCGKSFALYVARWMVLFLKRPGNQAQFTTPLDCQSINNLSMRSVCEWLLDHFSEDLRIEALAEYAAMSPRNFARVFARELHITPAKYIDKLRVDYACQYLVETQLSLDEIASQCGLKNVDNMRRQFIKILDTTPAQYRKSFLSSFG